MRWLQSTAATDVPNSASNNYTFSFTQFPDLQTVGGSVRVKVAATSGTKTRHRRSTFAPAGSVVAGPATTSLSMITGTLTGTGADFTIA